MSGSCHLDRAWNVEIGVECQIFLIVIFFNCLRVLQFGAHSRYCKGALTQKRSFIVICTTFRSAFHVGWKNQNKHSILNSSFDALFKWHEPNIRIAQHLIGNTVYCSKVNILIYLRPTYLQPRTTDIQRELFFKNLKLLGLGRQIGLKFWGAFWLFPAKLLALFWHCESIVHGKV